jgi:cell division protein ZapA (FtsZ GTPase activity inhibitor)
VSIGNETITLVSDEEESYIRELADYIESRMSEIAPLGARANFHPNVLSLSTAVLIADQLYKERAKSNAFEQEKEQNQKETDRLRALVDELWLALEQTWNDMNSYKEKLEQAKLEADEYKSGMDQAKNELREYIEAFDKPAIKGVYIS